MRKRAYSTTLRNLEYRLRAFKDSLPEYLEDIIKSKEDVIVSAVVNDQLYRRGVNGDDIKIDSYKPYAHSTIIRKLKKGQPTTRVTLRDTGKFHGEAYLVIDSEGFYVDSKAPVTDILIKRYGPKILRLTNKNLNRIIVSHIKKGLTKKLKTAIQK